MTTFQLASEKSALTAAVESAFPFTVVKSALTGPDNCPTPHFGLFRSDTWECTDFAPKKKYVPHQTSDVVALCEAAAPIFSGQDEPTIKAHWSNGHHVIVEPSREHRLSLFDGAENNFPRLFIRGSLNGDSYLVVLGLYRDACKNLEMIRAVDSCRVSIRHDTNLRSKMGELIDQCSRLEQGWEAMQDHIRAMAETQVNVNAMLAHLMPRPAEGDPQRQQTIWTNTIERITQRICRESVALGLPQPSESNGFSTNAWMAYNAVTGFVQYDKTRRGNPGEMQRILRAQDDPLAIAADNWTSAQLQAA